MKRLLFEAEKAVPSSAPEDSSSSSTLKTINFNCLQSAVLCLVSLSRCFMTFANDKEQQGKKESSEDKENNAKERTTTMALFADCVARLSCGYALVNDTHILLKKKKERKKP